ncbi:MAG: hypothetical protein B0W54_07785 [Cellvibrio sp. 79]|nr:MAG: hypothetical protein B0W54_07785 [Cellvibrio sp. 79]
MGDARNALHSRDSHIWTLRIALVFAFGLAFFQAYVNYQRQSEITVHVPPDLSRGATLKPGMLQKPNTYSFAHYVWRGLNDWPESGKADYKKAIEKYKCLITPEFESWLKKNMAEKSRAGELDRTRVLTEELFYQEGFVSDVGVNVFSVAMVMKLQERVGGMVIKNVAMNYSLRVVPDFRNCNEMGMAVDGFMVDPTRAEKEAEGKSKKERANKS